MPRLPDVLQGRLLRLVLACGAFFGVLALITDAPTLILIGNGLAISVAAGVCVAYASEIFGALGARKPTNGQLLGSGIFLVSASLLGMRLMSVVARDLMWPSVYNTDWMTAAIAVGLVGGLLHLWAPNAIEGRLPRERWASTGIIVSIGLFIVFCLWGRHFSTVHPPIELR